MLRCALKALRFKRDDDEEADTCRIYADGQYLAEHTLSDIYDLKFVSALREAEDLLTGPDRFDLIICGVHFDDSRMFELLQFVRTVEDLDALPFLVIQARHGTISIMNSVKFSAQTLGACGFLELQDLSPAKAQKLLRKAVKELLDKPVRYVRHNKMH